MKRGSWALADLLAGHAAENRSGVLTALKPLNPKAKSRVKLKRVFCMERGRLVFAMSNVLEEQLAEYLVAQGRIDEAQKQSCAERADNDKIPFSAALLASGLLPGPEIRELRGRQLQELLSSTLEWKDGEYTFEEGKARLGAEILCDVPAAAAVAFHTARFPEKADGVRAALGRADKRIELESEREGLLESLDDSPALGHLVEQADGSHSVSQMVNGFEGGSEPVLRTLHTLMLLGVLRHAKPKKAAETAAHVDQGPVTREEVLSRLHRAEDVDYYGLLGVAQETPRDRIREAYYQLARRMHPDRFRSGEMQDLLEQVEQFFSEVTLAYNTLVDPEARRIYDHAQQQQQQQANQPAAQDSGYLARQNFLRGKELADRKRWQDALTFLQNAIEMDDSQADFHVEIAIVKTQNPRLRGEAEEHLERALGLEPSSTRGLMAMGNLYLKTGREDQAAAKFREVLNWEPGHLEAGAALSALEGSPKKRGLFRG
ncbi:hypothetical protein ABI59_02230 [Acidobacteria bacterium Mor1]|nr:hypothetical protein ABI59_02230 [Acidobacteria bacterium Mor1]